MKLEQANKILSSKFGKIVRQLNGNILKPDIEIGGHYFLVNPSLNIDELSFTEGELDDNFLLYPPVAITYTYLSAPAKQLVLRVSIKVSELKCLKRPRIALENAITRAIAAMKTKIGFSPTEAHTGQYYLKIGHFRVICVRDNEPDSLVLTLNSSCVKVEDMVKLDKEQYKQLLRSRGI
jgi:hypothetical protein